MHRAARLRPRFPVSALRVTGTMVQVMDTEELLPGELAARAGVAVSALHFYERQGLITSRRTSGNQRRYSRDTLRRVAFIRMSHRLGLPPGRGPAGLGYAP